MGSYGQYCPLGYAMDILGERWTLLILREMIYGPRRFTDILEVLPGLGANVLAERLRKLEARGIVRLFSLASPLRGKVYELKLGTEYIDDAILNLVGGRMKLLEWPPPKGYFVTPMTAMFYMRDRFDCQRVEYDYFMTGQVQLSERFYFQAQIVDCKLEFGTVLIGKPEFWVETITEVWIEIVIGRLALREAIEQGEVSIPYGNIEDVEKFLEAFLPDE